MHRALVRPLRAATVVTLGVFLGTALASRPAAAIDKPSSIRITDREVSYHRYDEGPHGAGAGDVEIARQALYNKRITSKPIGHAELLCIYLNRRSRTCTTTYFLPKGKIVVEGAIGSRLLYELPVVGGTGLYANARGSLVVTLSATKPRREILTFRLLP